METPPPQDDDAIQFVLELGRALHQLGHPSHWLEDAMTRASLSLGLIGQFFTTPTSVFAAFGPQRHQHTYLLRVEPGEVNLGALTDAVRTGRAVMHRRITAAQGTERLRAILSARSPYSELVTAIAGAVSGAAAGRFLGGGVREIVVAAGCGAGVMIFSRLAARVPGLPRLFEPVTAFLVSAVVTLIATRTPLAIYPATVAGILILLPGLSITTAMTELSSSHLVSGTARLSGAFVRFLALAFGVAMGSRAVALLAGTPPHVTPPPLPEWTEMLALLAAPMAFTILLRARLRDFPWILGTGALAFFGGRIGAKWFGPELGVFAGAWTAGVLSNLVARGRASTPAVTLVPAILLIVPGSIGFRSLTLLLNRDVLSGVEAAFRMIIMIAALVAGLLVAGVFAPAPGIADVGFGREDELSA
jgi:uncharacterized membrane protein YjjP (DUF1212 family)